MNARSINLLLFKFEEKVRNREKWKTNNKMAIVNNTLSVNMLNANRLNTVLEEVSRWIKKK